MARQVRWSHCGTLCRSLLFLASILASASCQGVAGGRLLKQVPAKDLVDFLQTTPDFTTMLALIQGVQLETELMKLQRSAQNGITFLLPNDAAWDSFFVERGTNLTTMLEDPAGTEALLLYHIFPQMLMYDVNNNNPALMSMASGASTVSPCTLLDNSKGFCDMAGRSSAVLASRIRIGPRGLAYVLDRVLLNIRPADIDEALLLNTQFSVFRQMMAAAGFSQMMNNSNVSATVLVPSNEACATALVQLNMTLQTLLTEHAEDGGLLQTIVSSHIMPSVTRYATLVNWLGGRWFTTDNSCSFFYSELNYDWEVVLEGSSLIDASSAKLLDEDLFAGEIALMHAIDVMFLPVERVAAHNGLSKFQNTTCYIQGRDRLAPPSPPPPSPVPPPNPKGQGGNGNSTQGGDGQGNQGGNGNSTQGGNGQGNQGTR